MSSISPNMGDLIKHTQCIHQEPPHQAAIKRSIPSTFLTPSANRATRESVRWEYKAMEASGVYGWIEIDKPNIGVLSHGNSPRTSLPEKQQQADLIWL